MRMRSPAILLHKGFVVRGGRVAVVVEVIEVNVRRHLRLSHGAHEPACCSAGIHVRIAERSVQEMDLVQKRCECGGPVPRSS